MPSTAGKLVASVAVNSDQVYACCVVFDVTSLVVEHVDIPHAAEHGRKFVTSVSVNSDQVYA